MEDYDLEMKLLTAFKKMKKMNMQNMHNIKDCTLTSSQMFMLHHIYHKNKNLEKPTTVSQISKESNQTLSATTQIINSLDKEDYIKREIDKDDRRIIRITLTDKGKQHMKFHHDKLLEYVQGIVKKIGQEKTILFIDIIEKIISEDMEGDKEND